MVSDIEHICLTLVRQLCLLVDVFLQVSFHSRGLGQADSLPAVVSRWTDGANPCPVSQQPRCLPTHVLEDHVQLPEPGSF